MTAAGATTALVTAGTGTAICRLLLEDELAQYVDHGGQDDESDNDVLDVHYMILEVIW